MSWTSKLKKSLGDRSASAAAPAAEPAELDLPPVDPIDPRSATPDQIIDLLRDDLVLISEGKLSHEEIEADGHIFDYGYVDSLSGVVFLVRIEERFGIEIEDVELVESLTDLRAIAERIHRGA